MNENIDIRAIEKDMQTILNGITTIYKGQKPSNIDSTINDYIVASVSSGIRDMAAYGELVCRIEVFVRNMPDGTRNDKRFSKLHSDIRLKLPLTSKNYIYDINPTLIPLGNDEHRYYVEAYIINTTIKYK